MHSTNTRVPSTPAAPSSSHNKHHHPLYIYCRTMRVGVITRSFLGADTECGLYGDPHIRAFSGARGTIFLPCRFHAAQLFMNSPSSGICFTNILVFGVVRGKGVYTGGAEIHIILISNSHLKHSLQIVISEVSIFKQEIIWPIFY